MNQPVLIWEWTFQIMANLPFPQLDHSQLPYCHFEQPKSEAQNETENFLYSKAS